MLWATFTGAFIIPPPRILPPTRPSAMLSRTLVLALLLAAPLAPARDKPENWIQVISPHFVVATNASEKRGRRIADQFERMRSVFHGAFPKLEVDPGVPIVVLAVKDEKDFRALEPEEYLVKGSLKLGGLFLHGPDKNYVLMRIDAEGQHPYSVIYHEYTHLLISKSADWMPLWMNEGLAEFYENTEIHEKDASLGEPSAENIEWLRENRLLPLATLLTVDQKSPYYHEEKKGSIFYAESWALAHYIQMNDFSQKAHRLNDYSALLVQKVDPVTAATRVFGDLKQLEANLENYIRGGSFHYLKMTTMTEVDDSAFKVQSLTGTQSDALRADFLAYNHRATNAQGLLDRVLQEDPKNVLAHETKGFLASQQGHPDEAEKWYEQAVQLDSQSYLAHYYYAVSLMRDAREAPQQEHAESSLRAAVKLNPSFAPAFDSLGVLLAMRHKNLDEARSLGLTAISLDPANIGYRINVANILMTMDKGQNAIEVLRAAAKLTKTPEESQMLADALTHAQEYVDATAQFAAQQRRVQEDQTSQDETVSQGAVPKLKHRPQFVPKGPHRYAVGVLKSVTCDAPSLDLTVSGSGKALSLHVDNYYKVLFSTLGFQPDKDLNPCTDLENRPAKVEYVESANESVTAQIVSIELHK
jgi:tetratricopeptide (TPR) repeat protein